jgi:hypothetical protein
MHALLNHLGLEVAITVGAPDKDDEYEVRVRRG